MTKNQSKARDNLKYTNNSDIIKIRAGCKDVWNAYMAEGAAFTTNDIPFCPTTALEVPHAIVTWEEAKGIIKKNNAINDDRFFCDAFVCFYIDDYKFDGPRGIWNDSEHALSILRHFAGLITPDFSTYQDFPEPVKLFATYRMRLFGYWAGTKGLAVINNVRWGTPESFRYCFDGIPKSSIVAIGTVGGSPWKLEDRERFEDGLNELMIVLHPHTIIVYGSANYPCFENLRKQGVRVISFPSHTASAFERRRTK